MYAGETGRNLGVRVGEHRKEVEAKDVSRFTRQGKKSAEEQLHKSAITDHVTRDKKTVLSQGNRAMPHLFFSV